MLWFAGVFCWCLADPTTVEIAPGVVMPRVSLGTCCGSDPAVGVPTWFASGGVGIDSAWDYNNSKALQRALQQSGRRRADYFITTKVPAGVGADIQGPDAKGGSPGNASDCSTDPMVAVNYILNSLRQLQLGYVDLLLLHGPCSFAHPPVKNASASNNALWHGLEMAKAMGLTRAIGVSNYNATELANLRGASPAVNQCQMSVNTSHIYLPVPYPAPHDEETIQYCREHNITYQAYRILGGCPTHDRSLLSISERHNKTTAQICLRWVLQRGAILTAGTGSDPSKSSEYAKENLGLFDWQLSKTEMQVLDSINSTQPVRTFIL